MEADLAAGQHDRLFAAKGYDNTTLEEVAAAAGVSRRTLFNYFRNKEDLALSGLDEQGELIAARLAERPADEDPWAALRAAFQVLDEIGMTAEGRLEFITLLFGNDSPRRVFHERPPMKQPSADGHTAAGPRHPGRDRRVARLR
ncbi:TetR/AcrR family transcriptional regulator [Streptomyces sp. NPDC093984]|uniref:TetR/AcrR family transcriptional regulator n=1 Tax=Streptomyces sp. NPDC093984 TaxID=3366052 RepID=UPI0038182490